MRPDFSSFGRRKLREALAARLDPFVTIEDRSARFDLEPLSTSLTGPLLDGPLLQSVVRKRGTGRDEGVAFEHLQVADDRTIPPPSSGSRPIRRR
jgi:hypothetical protein